MELSLFYILGIGMLSNKSFENKFILLYAYICKPWKDNQLESYVIYISKIKEPYFVYWRRGQVLITVTKSLD